MTSPWPHADPRDVAQRILADRRFHTAPQRPGEKSWLELIADAIGDLWRRLMAPLDHLLGNQTLTTVIGIAVLVAVLVFLAVVVVRFTTRRRGQHPDGAIASATAFALGDDADARTLLARALAAAAQGRHHDAAALLWASALRALDERGRVRFDAARTPGEWRRAVRDPAFDALARDAVVALFGDRAVDASLVTRMRASYDRVVAPA
jgi:Na+-transporting methylmalonyl-CoA/oxaloacetate decarboxylase gamma subunit